MVAKLIDPVTRSWDRTALEVNFYPMDMKAILNFPLSSSIQCDSWAWHYEKKGTFLVWSAYRMLASIKQQRTDWLEHTGGHSETASDCRSSTRLWGALVPSKVKVFSWRLTRTSIPTGDVRKHRSMAAMAECSLCRATVDTWRHALFNCHMARYVWALEDEDLTETIISNRTEDAKLWMLWLVDTLPWPALARVLVMMWAIWWARRKEIFDEIFHSPLSSHLFINKFLAEVEMIPTLLNQAKERRLLSRGDPTRVQ
ncbi:hypothetical protein D1007_40399 [Hordeum vulgare]|nr:hypothetical protein D1007_40399 [Hordeum vulgare]